MHTAGLASAGLHVQSYLAPVVPTWTSREVTLPGPCPGGTWELRALPCDVQSPSTTLERKPGLWSAPAYSYSFPESMDRDWGDKPCRKQLLPRCWGAGS